MLSKPTLKRVVSIAGICAGCVTVCSGIIGGLGTYFGIPEIKQKVDKIETKTDTLIKTVSEIKGALQNENYKFGDHRGSIHSTNDFADWMQSR